MRVKVTVKQLGKRKDKVCEADFVLANPPHTVEELIRESVHTCVTEYNARVRQGDRVQVLDDEAVEEMSEIGKIAFGINYGQKEANEAEAVQNALLAYEDGLVRIFLGTEELEGLDCAIQLREGDVLTFVKLTMLAGRMF